MGEQRGDGADRPAMETGEPEAASDRLGPAEAESQMEGSVSHMTEAARPTDAGPERAEAESEAEDAESDEAASDEEAGPPLNREERRRQRFKRGSRPPYGQEGRRH